MGVISIVLSEGGVVLVWLGYRLMIALLRYRGVLVRVVGLKVPIDYMGLHIHCHILELLQLLPRVPGFLGG